MSRSKQVMQSPTGHAKNDGDRWSPEVLDEVKVNWNLDFISKILLFVLESEPSGVANCIHKKDLSFFIKKKNKK